MSRTTVTRVNAELLRRLKVEVVKDCGQLSGCLQEAVNHAVERELQSRRDARRPGSRGTPGKAATRTVAARLPAAAGE